MDSNPSIMHSVWDDFSGKMENCSTVHNFEEYNKLIASLFCPGPYYYYVVDFPGGDIQYMSEGVETILGINRNTVTFDNILNGIHPDDIGFVADAERAGFHYAGRSLGWENTLHYKFSYCFRSKVADGSYQLFHHQAIVLSIGESQGCWRALNIHTNIHKITTVNNHKIYLSNLRNNHEIIELSTDLKNEKLHYVSFFSKREKEVIELIKLGFRTKDIADKLFIAIDTVKNHRKNILKKAGVRNVAELITKYIGENVI
jgi:DNA-binding CsgD family transcriptional regulator